MNIPNEFLMSTLFKGIGSVQTFQNTQITQNEYDAKLKDPRSLLSTDISYEKWVSVFIFADSIPPPHVH